MTVKSYGFAVGNLRARENSLLKQSDYAALLGAESIEELTALMQEKGIGGTLEKMSIPEMLSAKTKRLWEYITDIAPDMSVFNPFLYENDFHNLKAILKATVSHNPFASLVAEPATVSSELIKTAVEEKKFACLPELLKQAASEAYEILTQSGDTQACDCIIDAACINARMRAAQISGNKTVLSIIRIDSFYKNIKVALRAAKAGKSSAFLEKALAFNGIVSVSDLKSAALSGEKKVLELLSSKTEVGGKGAAESFEKSPSEFERYTDNLILAEAKRCKYITIGAEPLIGYMMAELFEIKNLRIIYSGIKTGQSEETIKERLRDSYG